MEFFESCKTTDTDILELKNILVINKLPELCRSISKVLSDSNEYGVIYCLWGEFKINREELKQGIRFSMPDCPNALAWTITMESDHSIIIHCTINKNEHDPDFIRSIEEFVYDWKEGLDNLFKK